MALLESECIGYDVIGVTETWLDDSVTNESIQIPSYQPPIRKDRDNGRGSGGVCFYVRDNLIVKKRNDLDIEGLEALWIEVSNSKFKFLACTIYRPPKSNANYWNLINDSIAGAKSTTIKNIFIMGDLNDDQLQPNSKLHEILTRHHLEQVISEPTYVTETSATCLDIRATSSIDYVEKSGIMPPSIGDHCLVYICLKIMKPKTPVFKRMITKTDHVNWQDVSNELSNLDWSEVYNQPCVDTMLQKWKELYLNIINKYVETKVITVRPSEPPWMSPEVRRIIRRKNRAHKQAKRTNSPIHWTTYRKWRNKAISECRKAKQYHKDKLSAKIANQTETSPRLWWKLVKDFYQLSSNSSKLSKPLIVDNKVLTSDIDKANALNNFFSEQCHLDTDGATLPDTEPLDTSNLKMINITARSVKDIIDILNTSKSSGPDDIKAIFLKNTSGAIAPVLAKIFNFSLRTSTFPDIWKLAFITPLHKKDEEYYCKNYRPISLLPCLSKVFERCVFKEVYNYFIRTNKISRLQAAYNPGSCTEFQLLELYHIISESMAQGKSTRFVFCDVSKAFDKVWHSGIIYKLNQAGIGGKLLDWFQSYLSNRRQCVMVNGVTSNIRNITAGVPQGSILGPMLFLIYINDIVDVVETNIRLYADDSTLFVIKNNQHDAAVALNKDLENISLWAKKWFVKFNASKTESLTFRRNLNAQIEKLYMDGVEITEVTSHKHLGCVLQYNGKWNRHIEEILRKCTRRIDVLRGLKFQLDRRTLEILYASFIKPIFEYANAVWANCTKEQLESVENLQMAACRIITGAIRGTSHEKIYKETNMLNTYEMRDRRHLVLFYKIYHGHTPSYLTSLLPKHTRQQSDYRLRNREALQTYKITKTQFTKTFFPTMVRKWNFLDNDIKYIGSIHDLKHKLKQTDKRMPLYYYCADRYSQVLHSRMRMECSPLKSDLFNMHIIESKECDCGHHTENSKHFFLECPLYDNARQELANANPGVDMTIQNILFGDRNASNSRNRQFFLNIAKFIKDSERFKKKV